jgi:hypothetical protein
MDCLYRRIRQLGFVSDGTFSGPLAKLTLVAVASLIEDLLLVEQKGQDEEASSPPWNSWR